MNLVLIALAQFKKNMPRIEDYTKYMHEQSHTFNLWELNLNEGQSYKKFHATYWGQFYGAHSILL